MLQLLWEYFGQKLCTFYTIFSMIRVYKKQNGLLFFQNYPFALKKKIRERGGSGVLVIVVSGSVLDWLQSLKQFFNVS